MKVNLTLNKPLNGFLNLNPLAQPTDTDQIKIDPTNTDDILDNNEVEEFISLEVLDYIPLQLRQRTLQNWLQKIAHGGTIVLSGLDLVEASRLILNTSSNIVEVNRLIYGAGTNLWTIRKSFLSPNDTAGMIMQTGQFTIENLKYDGPTYIIKAKRK